jgi:SAM-dependent methyltransferase
MQKSPTPPIDELMRCYREASSDNWGHDVDTEARQIPLLGNMLRERQPSGGRLLDVGCSNGAIASAIEGDWQRFGVEPSREAGVLASQRGVHIVAPSIDEMGSETLYTAILALDLVEHITTPLAFMTRMRSLLAPGGTLLILTGDTDSPTWRIFGGYHWYCSLPEHVIFFNERSLAWLAEHSGFAMDGMVRIPHYKLSWQQRLNQFIRVHIWRTTRLVRGLGIPRLRRWATKNRAPFWSAQTDHMLVALRAV